MMFPKLASSRALFLLFALTPLFQASETAQGQNLKGNWISGPSADNLWADMAKSPYTQNGNKGLVVYMLSYSSCGNCIVFLRDFWESHKSNMQLREVFAPVNQARLLDEAADMALTRNPAFADAYYHRTRSAPLVSSSPERQVALRQVVDFTNHMNAVFQQIGHVQDGFPTFIFWAPADTGGRRLCIVSGWGPELAADMDRWVRQAAH